MARKLYTLFFYLIMPLVLLRLLYRAIKAPAYRRRVAERFGFFSHPLLTGSIWVHAVSVGETIACAPLVKQLREQYPQKMIVVTTMTPTGSERVRAIFGEEVFHVYAPYDLPGSISRFLRRVKPSILIIMETELWPNTIHYCHHSDIPIVVANARLSARSARGYGRLSNLSSTMLQQISTVAAQYQADGERFIELGLPPAALAVTGSIKFDIELADDLRQQASELKILWSGLGSESGEGRVVFLAASTHSGEDEIIIDAFKRVANKNPRLLLVLVPRHPERFDTVAALCDKSGLNTLRRSSGLAPGADTQVLLGDSMGELLLFYGCADIAFVGGSLVNNGGHNMLEAAAWALPIVSGDSVFNFADISAKLVEAKALTIVRGGDELTSTLQNLVVDKTLRHTMGAAAVEVVEQNRGSLKRLLDIVKITLLPL